MIARIRAKVIRVYFNRHGDLAKVWSLDTGAGTREYMVGDVHIRGLEAVFRYDPTVTDPEQAKAWVQVEDATMFINTSALLVPTGAGR